MPLSRDDLEARYQVFDYFALQDQRNYYKSTAAKNRLAATQVNRFRALMALLTGFSAAAAGLLVQALFINSGQCAAGAPNEFSSLCSMMRFLVVLFAIAAVVLPVFGASFGTLADLFQWDRLITIYDTALENIEVADAQSPSGKITDEIIYRAAFNAYVEGTLSVMSDETAQWGQAIRTPPQLEQYIDEARRKAEQYSGRSSGATPETPSN